jgi:hypothetical protein
MKWLALCGLALWALAVFLGTTMGAIAVWPRKDRKLCLLLLAVFFTLCIVLFKNALAFFLSW